MAEASAPSPTSSPGPGRVVVCLAPVDLRPEVDPISGEVRSDDRRATLIASEAAAMEYGLRASEIWGLSLLVVAAGPASMDPTLAEAVSLGAEALRVPLGPAGPLSASHLIGPSIVEPAELGSDSHETARALAAAIGGAGAIGEAGAAQLVVCGDRSGRSGTGSMPAFLAHHLGFAQALGCVSVKFHSSVPGRVVVERRLDRGWKEILRLDGPSVISVEAAGVRLRRASLASAVASRGTSVPTAPVRTWSTPPVASVRVGAPVPYRPRTRVVDPPAGDTRDRLLALTGALSTREPPRIVGPMDPAAAADELMAFLGRRGAIQDPPLDRASTTHPGD